MTAVVNSIAQGAAPSAIEGARSVNSSGRGSGPVSATVDPRGTGRTVTNSYGVSSVSDNEGYTYGGPGGGSGGVGK